MSLFDEVSALMRTGVVYIVDVEEGRYLPFTAQDFAVVSGLLDLDRFQVRMSQEAAEELVQKHALKKAGKN